MSARDYYKVTFTSDDSDSRNVNSIHGDVLDNDTEFNANQFKLYDDFTTDLRISFNTLRNFGSIGSKHSRRAGDPNDSGVDMENGNPLDDTRNNYSDLLENEVMVDPWSSMDSSNSPLTDSGPSASEDCTPSTSSEPPRGPLNISSPVSPGACRLQDPQDAKPKTIKPAPYKTTDKALSRDLSLQLDTLEPDPLPRLPHFLDEDYQPPSKTNIECRIPKPHFLDHSPSPDELDERNDITNPNFLDEDGDTDDLQAQRKAGALPKKSLRTHPPTYPLTDERSHRTTYRSTLHYGLESAARSSERDKRASQLYRGTWPGERDVWTGHDSASVRSFSSNGSTDGPRPPSSLENKMECVCSLISLLTLSPENNADLSGPLLDMSRSVESCVAMRQAGCIPLLVQLIHSKVSRETRDRAAKALRNIIHTQTDDKAGRREARVWRLLEQVREYCYSLEDLVEARKEGKEAVDDDTTKHPSQSVAALMKLSFDEEHRHVVCQLGGLQALAALVSGDQAAHGSGTDDNTCLTMRKYAGMTLTNLTFGDGNNKSLLCSFKDFMLALVEQLESPNDDMRQVTAAVLRNLSWRADTNSKQVLREVGAVKGLTKAAMTCQKEATLKSVLSALWNLTAHCSMNKVALCSVDGALGFLVDKLSYNSPTKTLAIVENAGGIMRNVSSHIAVREDYRQILRERNCLGVLLQHLKSPSLTVVSNSCGTLWNLSARCPQDQQFLWDHGAVPMLRSLIHSKHKMIAMGSSAALKNLLNSKPGKTQILTLDTTARNMNLPALPTLGARKQKALEQELDQNLAETCDNIEPATSPMTSNREEKNLFTATERQIAMNLERHRMTSSSPLMGNLASQISLSHSAQLSGYLSCSNTLLKGSLVTRSTTGGSASNVNRSESKDSVTSTHSDSVFEKVMRTGKVPIPTPRSKDLMKMETASEAFNVTSKLKGGPFLRYPSQPPIPPPRSTTEMRTNYTESGYDVDQDSCDQPIDFSRKYSETKANDVEPVECKPKSEEQSKKYTKNKNTFGDYQETDLDQPTDYSLRYAEHPSEHGSDVSPPPGPSVHEDTIKHFATEGTPYETPVIFSTATSMSDLRVIGKEGKPKTAPNVKEHPEVLMSNSDEKDTCSLDDPPRHDNDRAILSTPSASEPPKPSVFDTKFSSGMISPEKPVNYCDEGTPGYFSRVSSLSSLGDPTEEDNVAKKNAMATINVEPSQQEQNTTSVKDKEGSKAVTFATEAVSMGASGGASPRFVEDTPLMFSRTSSLGSLPECDQQDDQGSVLSEMSRLTSGCISPSEIPDSPGGSVSPSSRPPPTVLRAITPPTDANRVSSVFEERTSRFMVEHTPAQFSTATSLSSLTIDDEPKLAAEEEANTLSKCGDDAQATSAVGGDPVGILGSNTDPASDEVTKGLCIGGDSCRVYVTEDTPGMSKAGSHSELSALSIDSEPKGGPNAGPTDPPPHDTSDSSNLSDAGDLLEECIQKGIANVVKNNGPPSDVSSINLHRDGVYRSLPPYLRSSTETVRMSHEYGRSARDSHSPSSERGACGRFGVERSEGVKGVQGVDGSPPPPLPPRPAALPAPPPRPPPPPPHEAPPFEGRRHESRLPVKASRHRANPAKAAAALLRNDSLSSLSNDSFGSTDREIFEETVQAGLSNPRNRYAHDKGKAHSAERPSDVQRHARHHKSLDRGDRTAQHRPKPGLTRSPYSYHGETSGRSDSLSSLSNESFGSTDKEVFEKCVRAGMRAPTASSALERMRGDHYSRDRAILEEVIARGANSSQPNPNSKNVRTPPADADAGGDGTAPNITGSNECLAPRSHNTTLDDEPGEDLDESNESYADLPDGEWSDGDPAPTLKCADTWNDNTCPDDVTFPTISGSVHLETSIRSEVADAGVALPDLLVKSELTNMSRSRPDLTNGVLLEISEPSFASLLESGEQRFDSIVSSAIEREAARLAAQLKSSLLEQGAMETSVTSLQSLDLDNVKPPSDLGSLLSLSASGQWDESQASRKSQRRKKSLPVALMVKRALGNSMHRGSSEHLDSNLSFLDNVKPPSEMDHIDMESSMVSVSSIVSEVEGIKTERIPVVFDLSQPVQEFPLHGNLPHLYHDLDKVNPPSLFDEMAESTVEIEQTTAHQVIDDCASSTLNVVTDLPSGSENCTPLPSDVSSVESTPKKQRDPGYLTPKERRHASKDRYQTYTITDYTAESDAVLEVNSEEYFTWTKSVDELSTDSSAATSGQTSRRKVSAKQRRLEDRARYQTQTVNVHSVLAQETNSSDPNIQSLKRRLAAKKTIKQKRIEDAERFRTRTLSEDIPPSPTFVTKDANFENVETTTGYDSLSSNEIGHQIIDERQSDDVLSRDADSGHNEDDFELNSTQMQTYTRSFRTYLPVVESPASVDMCVVNNLKNIELTASYNRTMRVDKNQTPSSGDFASYEGDTNSDKGHSDSEENSPRSRAKPKIIKPEAKREASLDSNDSREEQDVPKAVRGRKKPAYVSPYRRNVNVTNTKKPVTPIAKTTPKVIKAPAKTSTSAKTAASTKTPNATTSPKKAVPNRSPTKVAQQKQIAPGGSKPVPLVRQGTFTKEESSVPAKDLPVPDKRTAVRATKATTPTKPANTSPSRLPQMNRYRPPLRKTNSNEKPKANAKKNESAMRTSASNHSLQSNESGKTVTLGSRKGSASSVNSAQSSKAIAKDVESKIASLWKKVEQSKKLTSKQDKRVWIEADKAETPRLIRSSTFEGQPKQTVSAAPKQKTTIGIRVSQIPSLRPKTAPNKGNVQVSATKKPIGRVFARKQAST